MKKDNKTFVKSMIITSVIGFSVLMITMFIGIKYYVDKNGTSSKLKTEVMADTQAPKVEYSSTVLALVRKVSEDNLVAFDIEKNQEIDKSITSTTKVNDEYGEVMPLSSIETGDIVEVIFQPDQQKILSISKTTRSWNKPNISGVSVDSTGSQAMIGKKSYKLSKDTMIYRENGDPVNSIFIGEYDVLKLQGVEDTIWSIKVVKSAASLELLDMPKLDGMLEIDRTRMVPLSTLAGPVSLTAGKHKIQVNIKGYEPVIKEITVAPEECYQLSLKDVKEAFTELHVKVANTDADYTVQVGNRTFSRGQKISVRQDNYTIIIKAPGYKDWQQTIELNIPTYDLNVALTKEEEPVSTDASGTDIAPGSGETDNTNALNGVYTINISSDPSDAHVYIGGIYKGQTPFRTTLPIGDYSVSLEKTGYETYNTTIIIDNSDNQNSFLYVLTPEQ